MPENSAKRLRDFVILAALVVVWIVIDQATKAYVNSYQLDSTIAGPFLGIFDITLVRNTGAAWGFFNGSSVLLGAFSLVICALAVVYLALVRPPASVVSVIGLSLVVAGGIGNAIDRFANQYVIDFIRPVFIDFPVFNVADIGVTVGVVIFAASLIWEAFKPSVEDANE